MNTDGRTSNEFFAGGLSDSKKHSRRMRILITVGIIVFALIVELLRSNLFISVDEITFLSNDIPKSFAGVKIVQISDFHNSTSIMDRLLDKVEAQKPDYIFLTGDIVDQSRTNLDTAMTFVDKLSKIADTYIVLGNHDTALSIEDQKKLSDSFKKSGAHLLDNDYTSLERGGSRIMLVGTTYSPDDYYSQSLMARLPRDEKCVIWLHHYPEDFKTILTESEKLGSRADLIFAGHAHGGLIGVPFTEGLYSPGEGFFPKCTSGRYNDGNSAMIVSRGVGNSGYTLRLFNSLHLVVCELESGKQK